MAFSRGKFGIEYIPEHLDKEPSGFGWVIVVVAFVALISFTCTFVKRIRASRAEQEAINIIVTEHLSGRNADATPDSRQPAATNSPPEKVVKIVEATAIMKRPPKVRNLLLRLSEAEKRRDIEMAISTIEQLRVLPGSPAADIDDALARRLGTLNMRKMFEVKSAQWVAEVEARRGDSATRIAAESGSTLASFARLNGGNVDKVVRGTKLYVLSHPKFNLVVHRRSRTADLSLNGKFFKRYDLAGEVGGKIGVYEIPMSLRNFWTSLGIVLKSGDRAELEMLMPKGSPVLISEM